MVKNQCQYIENGICRSNHHHPVELQEARLEYVQNVEGYVNKTNASEDEKLKFYNVEGAVSYV